MKKVLPGQMGGPDVLKENTDVREALSAGLSSPPAALSLVAFLQPSLVVTLKHCFKNN